MEFFKKEIAGFPVWVWLLIIGGGVAVGLFFMKQQQSAPTLDTSGTPTGTGYGGSPIPPPDTLPLPGPPIMPPVVQRVYIVQKGETIQSIAQHLGVTVDHIWQNNRWTICQCVLYWIKSVKSCDARRGQSLPQGVGVLCEGLGLNY